MFVNYGKIKDRRLRFHCGKPTSVKVIYISKKIGLYSLSFVEVWRTYTVGTSAKYK